MKITPPSRFEELRENYGSFAYARATLEEELRPMLKSAEPTTSNEREAVETCHQMAQEIEEYLTMENDND